MNAFIHEHCGGSVDCATAWCAAGEAVCRAAVARAGLIKSCVLFGTQCVPQDPDQVVAMQSVMAETPPEAFVDMIWNGLPNSALSDQSNELVATRRAQVSEWGNYCLSLCQWGSEVYGPGGLMAEMTRNSPFWRDWGRVAVPVYVIAGSDDVQMLSGMLNLVAAVPHGRLELLPGVGAVPFVEASEVFIEKVIAFLESIGHAKVV